MDIAFMVFIALIFFGILGVAIFAVRKQLKKTNLKDGDMSTKVETAQDFLPFKDDIENGVINLGKHDYRVIIECSSTNYNLKTNKEKEIIEISFQRFLNSLTFPIYFFVQTKILDNTNLLNQMEKELSEIIEKYPQIEDYANIYLREMSGLSERIGNNRQKKKYIIVPFNGAINLEELSEEEKYEYSVKEITQRALMIIDGLSLVDVKAALLNTKELIELFCSTYHRDNFSHYESIVNEDLLSLVVNGERNLEKTLTNDIRMDWILHEAQSRIEKEIVDKNISDFLKDEYNRIIKKIDEIRDDFGAYYKEEKSK